MSLALRAVGAEQIVGLRTALDEFEPARRVAVLWGRHLAEVLPRGHRLLVAGNGGSAAQAQHLTAELVGRFRQDRGAYSALCLSSETSTVTAVVNDYGADELFARQVGAHGRVGDVFLAMSTSGRSRNLLRACDAAHERGLTVWAMTGSGVTDLGRAADQVLQAPSSVGSTVQELHLLSLHVLCAAFDAGVSA